MKREQSFAEEYHDAILWYVAHFLEKRLLKVSVQDGIVQNGLAYYQHADVLVDNFVQNRLRDRNRPSNSPSIQTDIAQLVRGLVYTHLMPFPRKRNEFASYLLARLYQAEGFRPALKNESHLSLGARIIKEAIAAINPWKKSESPIGIRTLGFWERMRRNWLALISNEHDPGRKILNYKFRNDLKHRGVRKIRCLKVKGNFKQKHGTLENAFRQFN